MPTDLRCTISQTGVRVGLSEVPICLTVGFCFTLSFISLQMLHSLRQESVDAVDPCGSAVLRQILISLLEVKEREVLFLMCYS